MTDATKMTSSERDRLTREIERIDSAQRRGKPVGLVSVIARCCHDPRYTIADINRMAAERGIKLRADGARAAGEREGQAMNKRYIAAGIVGAIGFLITIGSVGSADFGDISIGEFAARSVIGILLMAASVPLSGDLTADDYATKKRKGGNDDTH